MKVSINSDMGESLGIHTFGNDDGLLNLIDTANVACGFHSGDPVGIHETVVKAAHAGITVGAHPGLPDIWGFGRREMKLTQEEVRDIILYQVGCPVELPQSAGAGTGSHQAPRIPLWHGCPGRTPDGRRLRCC